MTKKFPVLPVLSSVRDAFGRDLSGIYLVATQHLLLTTGSLFESMFELGLKPSQTYVCGKLYSTAKFVSDELRGLGVYVQPATICFRPGEFVGAFTNDIRRLWRRVEEDLPKDRSVAIIVLDDGGRCLSNIPSAIRSKHCIVGIEQTTAGVHLQHLTLGLPIVQVAQSAAKRYVESPLVCSAVIQKVRAKAFSFDDGSTCGVLGLGFIGRAVALELIRLRRKVVVFDKLGVKRFGEFGQQWGDSVTGVFNKSSWIFGCTGADTVDETDIDGIGIEGEKRLVSCSSEDQEFRSWLTQCQYDSNGNPLNDLKTVRANASITFLRGGFPINFDGTGESVPAKDIQLTRGLLFGAVLQATTVEQNKRSVMLDPAIQKFVLQRWMDCTERTLQSHVLDLKWITRHSEHQVKYEGDDTT